jgi:integrase/recombinase XerD
MDHTTISLTELVSKAKMQLDLLGYAEGTKKQYALKWDHFLMYAELNGHTHFSKELGSVFLVKYYRIKGGKKLSASQVFKVRTITVLGELLERNCFRKCHQRTGKQPPQQFLNVLNEYEKQQQEKKLSKRTICGKKIILVRFLIYLDKQGITDITSLTSIEVLSYLPTLEKYRNNTRSGILFSLRNFFLFLYSEGYIAEPLNNLFPVIFSNKFDRLPSYYSADEVHDILCQVDRNSTFGRRDYLILLLAFQLGLRAGDIRQLKFKDIKWSRSTVEFVQQKTNAPLQLPLTEEFKYAVADYMKNSRPEVDNPHIFVRHRAPFQPFAKSNTFHHIVYKYMLLAGTELNGRRHGLHSMRHSSASNLLQNNIPYPVIAGILGHKNTETTKLYLRIDIQQLRTVALEVPDEK